MIEPSIEKSDLEVLKFFIVYNKGFPDVVLEIGMHRGYSLKHWSEYLLPKLIIGVELSDCPKEAYKEGKSGEEQLDDFTQERVMLWNSNSHHETTLLSVKNHLKDKKVGFLFIDGDHSYEGVKKDFEMYAPLVEENGIIALHDICYTAPSEQVKPFWEELKQKYPYVEIRTSPNSTGMGVIFNTPLKFMEDGK